METVLRSASREVVIGPQQPFCIIGERINPTGRKIFQEQLRRGDLSRIEIDVAQQVAGGAMVLDVNMGAPLADEAELMVAAVKLIQGLTDLPLCIDSSIIEVLDAGLAAYQGKALVNSVTAEDERLEAILPLVKKYGAAVIALPNDEEEIPEDPRKRLDLARKIIDVATGRFGIPAEDIVIDPLAMPVGADTSLVVKTMETISLLREEFGVNTTLGASNVSFGMPDRHAIGAAFLPMAITSGLTSAILDARAPQIVRAVQAADLLLDRDPWGASWIAAHRAQQAAQAARPRQAAAGRDVTTGADTGTPTFPLDGAGPRRPAVRAQRPPGAGARRGERVRRRELERHRHRLHLRRPRHLQEVQGADAGRGGGAVGAGHPRVLPRRTARRLAAGLPGAGRRRRADRRPPAGHPAQGGHRRGRPPGHPAARGAEALPGAGRAVPGRPAQ